MKAASLLPRSKGSFLLLFLIRGRKLRSSSAPILPVVLRINLGLPRLKNPIVDPRAELSAMPGGTQHKCSEGHRLPAQRAGDREISPGDRLARSAISLVG